ncbi:DUF4251 domain-containing protein [Halosquirtibacter xylanolyticus]|uniref:DUF4251 domain-containing protein n=1 Tax=Halosquirtibacter xylanolyticus TaxID=3374599 RepID=UPI00374837D0|nr:DUF4251 domain-containing protein [Prolixibacteraceae bacterium]
MKGRFQVIAITLLCSLFFSISMLQAQEPEKEMTRKEKKALKKKQREESEKLQFDKASNALKNDRWVLEANTVYNKRGQSLQVTSNTNFVTVQGEDVYVQLAFTNFVGGPNGIGGITLKGRQTKKELNTDKHGNVTLRMSVIGNALTVDITVNLTTGGNYADATVEAITRGTRLRFSGNLFDIAESTYYKSGMDF